MRVKLISKTTDMLKAIYVAARTCYNPGSPVDLFLDDINNEKMEKLVTTVAGSGHESILEHGNFTFAIEGISRACSHQLVRHRHCSLSQQSQRYVEIKENHLELFDLVNGFATDEKIAKMQEIASKYFVGVNDSNYYSYVQGLLFYTMRIANGEKAEDARNSLPNAAKTNLVITCNLRELSHIAGLRLCTRAQREIRNLVDLMRLEAIKSEPWVTSFIKCKCDKLGYCNEHKGCGRKPTLNQILYGDGKPKTSMT